MGAYVVETIVYLIFVLMLLEICTREGSKNTPSSLFEHFRPGSVSLTLTTPKEAEVHQILFALTIACSSQ